MPKTKFERLETPVSDIAAFRISGKLGFHENVKVEHLVDECDRREFTSVIFDFTELSSLGGGVAKILRKFISDQKEKGSEVRFVITNDIVLDFLRDDDSEILVYSSMDKAYEACPALGDSASVDPPVSEESPWSSSDEAVEEGKVSDPVETAPAVDVTAEVPEGDSGVILMSYDGGEDQVAPEETEAAGMDDDITAEGDSFSSGETVEGGTDEGIISAIFKKGDKEDQSSSKTAGPSLREEPRGRESETAGDVNIKLKRRLLELKTLLSISADFNAIRDKKSLIDIFLLTSIAQGGVESAVFFERVEGTYIPSMMKGLDASETGPFSLTPEDEKQIAGTREVMSVGAVQFNEDAVAVIEKAGLEFFCPFMTSEGLAGLVFLGKRITGRGMKKEDFEFMKIMVNVASGAYHNALMSEREQERTLGIVKSLISLIEENTLLTGTSEFVSRYVGMVAKNMDYPEEHFKDLVYGTVLRDMGMIKVSDLILRSPRELSKEEWNIINRHPEDGSEMLKRMKFNDHVVNIVLSHHERFNGEGYPRGLRGREIPFGARIISVVESYSAMIHERPNRPALSSKEALDTLKENYGLRYDREVVRQFVKIMEKEMAKSVRPSMAVS